MSNIVKAAKKELVRLEGMKKIDNFFDISIYVRMSV